MLDSILARPPSSPSNNHPSSPIKQRVESKTVLCFQENESKAAAAMVTANCNGNGQANQVYRNHIEDHQYDENEDDQVDYDDQLNACATKDADDDGDDDGARTMLHDHDHCGELMVDVVDKPCSPPPPDDDDNDTTSSSTNNDNKGQTIETATTMDPSKMNGNMNHARGTPKTSPPPPQPPQPSESSDHPGPMVPVNGGHHHSCLQRIKSQHLHYNNHNHHQQPEQDLNRKPSSKFTAFR